MDGPIMAASNAKDKMGETASNRNLEVSVSFGRFENDSLSWEKWSSFSPNKYMEEAEKCATPGSVAMKKAYFEAHYKKIAARKAEQMEKEKPMGYGSPGSNDQNGGYDTRRACEEDSEFDKFSMQASTEKTRQETKLDTCHIDNEIGDTKIDLEVQGLSIIERVIKEELGGRLDEPTLDKLKEAPLVGEAESIPVESKEIMDLPKKLEKGAVSNHVVKEETAKLHHRKEPQKASSMNKLRDNVSKMKKKPASPVAKSTQLRTPKVMTTVPTSGSSTLSTPLSSTKKATASSLSKSKHASISGNKKVAPKSLHMSLSMDTSNSSTGPLTTAHPTTARKSFIMEKMKDKEIVKRAFKTFQNNFSQLKSSVEEGSLAAKRVLTKGAEVKVSSPVTPWKEDAGSFKAISMDKKTAKAAPSLHGLKSGENAERRKEVFKKLDENTSAKKAESTHLRTKSKEEKQPVDRKLRQSLNLKATPMPSFFRGQKLSKSPLDKEGSKTLGM